jgi:hypothetical protein
MIDVLVESETGLVGSGSGLGTTGGGGVSSLGGVMDGVDVVALLEDEAGAETAVGAGDAAGVEMDFFFFAGVVVVLVATVGVDRAPADEDVVEAVATRGLETGVMTAVVVEALLEAATFLSDGAGEAVEEAVAADKGAVAPTLWCVDVGAVVLVAEEPWVCEGRDD